MRIVQGLEAAARFRGQHRAISDASHQDIPYPPDPNDDAAADTDEPDQQALMDAFMAKESDFEYKGLSASLALPDPSQSLGHVEGLSVADARQWSYTRGFGRDASSVYLL